MPPLWYFAFLVGFLTLSLAGALFALSVRWTGVHLVAFPANGAATTAPVPPRKRFRPWAFNLGIGLLWFTVAAFLVSLIARTVASQAPPMATMWGYFVSMAFAMTLFAGCFGPRYREPAIPLLLAGVVFIGLASSERYFTSAISPLIPALQANRILTVHVSTMTLAYGLITTAGTASVAYLLKSYWPWLPGLPSADKAYRIAHHASILALPVLTLGVALGAYWANSAWGRYWGWDPKETMSLITLLTLVEYMHMQGLRKWRGRRASWVLVISFGTIVFDMAAVNFWVVGLHSYAR